jgi:sugar transferase EpsL
MKRLFDLGVSFLALVVLSPLILTVMALVGWNLGRPIFFRQPRAGLHGKPFSLIKFRTMLEDTKADLDRGKADDSRRLTSFGRLLRSTSLDELPELWNVLRGHMSLVGPRPLLMSYLPLYTKEQMRRHNVRPGITGWAQVNGRNSLSWEDRFALDVWYVDNHSFFLDAKIIGWTLVQVLRRDGINAAGEATMPRFTGSVDADHV